MADDIVVKLKMSADLVAQFPKATAKNLFPTIWLYEAAEEIDVLRQQLRALEAERDQWQRQAIGG